MDYFSIWTKNNSRVKCVAISNQRERYKLAHFPIAGIRSLQKRPKEGRVYFGPQVQIWSIMRRKARCQERGAAGGIASTVRKQMNAGGRLAFSFLLSPDFNSWDDAALIQGPHSLHS